MADTVLPLVLCWTENIQTSLRFDHFYMHACAHTHTHTVAGMQKYMCKSVKHFLGNVCFVDTAQCRFRVRRLWLCPLFVRQRFSQCPVKTFLFIVFSMYLSQIAIALTLWVSCCNTGHWPPLTPLSEYNLNLFVFLLMCLFLLTIIVSSSSNSISSSSSSHSNNACKDFSHWVMQKANHF